MIWISDDIDRLLLGAAVVLFAAGAALRGWFRTSWLASIMKEVVRREDRDSADFDFIVIPGSSWFAVRGSDSRVAQHCNGDNILVVSTKLLRRDDT